MWDKIARGVGQSLHTGSKFMDFSIFSTKVCEKKRIHHWCSVGTGKSQPEGPPFQWETRLRRVSHWNGGPEGWDFPVPLYTNDRFYFSHI